MSLCVMGFNLEFDHVPIFFFRHALHESRPVGHRGEKSKVKMDSLSQAPTAS